MSLARLLLSSLPAALLAFAATSRAGAQSGPGPLDDARVLPAGVLRVSIAPAWTSADRRFGSIWNGGSRSEDFGAYLSSDSLGTRDVPTLGEFEQEIRRTTGLDDFRLNLGRLRVGAQAQSTIVPISIEYGIGKRISVGVLLPIVRSVINLSVTGNVTDSTANAGVSPGVYDPGEASRITQLAAQFTTALNQLRSRHASCFGSSPAAGCAPVIALDSSARAYASLISSTYGAIALVPLAGTAAQDSVVTRLDALNAEFRTHLGLASTAPNPIAIRPRGALPIGVADVHLLTRDPAFGIVGDSVRAMELTTLGDVEAGITFGLIDRRSVARGLRLRAAATALFRYGTGRPGNADALIGPATGDGQHDIEGRIVADVGLSSRFTATAFARYTLQLPDELDWRLPAIDARLLPASSRAVLSRNLGDEIGVDAYMRFFINSYLSASAGYGFSRHGADTYEQTSASVGGMTFTSPARSAQTFALGIQYSTVDAFQRGKMWAPIEIGYLQRHTFAGSGGMPRLVSDAVELRVYAGGARRILPR